MERWKDIEGYEGFYQVSNNLRIKSIQRMANHAKGGKRKVKERILKMPINSAGYQIVSLSKNNVATEIHVHRLIACAFIPNPNNYPVVRHLNDIRTDNRIENLAWGTHADNAMDGYKNGVRKGRPGILHENSKVIKAINLENNNIIIGYGTRDTAKKTGIGRTLVMKSLQRGIPVRGFIFHYKAS